MLLRTLGVATLAVMLPVGASAQQSQPSAPPPPQQQSSSSSFARVTWTLGAATAVTLGNTRDRFTNGAQLLFGAGYPVTDRFSLQVEYALSFHSIKAGFFDVDKIRGTSRMHQFNFDGRWALSKPADRVQFFLVGGPGVYKRSVEITAYQASAPVCDPYLLNCGVTTTADEMGSRHTWDFGFNVGGGFTLPMSDMLRVSFEMRYLYVFGPTVGAGAPLPAGAATKAAGQFLPLMVGFRF
jgi:opacity protein-like surface antigen